MIAEYIDGGLEPRQRAEVEAHLAGCGECYEEFSEAVTISRDVGATPIGIKNVRRWLLPGAAAAIAASVVFGVVRPDVMWHDRQVREAADALVAAQPSTRLTSGRLAAAFAWAPGPAQLRGDADTKSVPFLAAADALERRTAGSKSPLDLNGQALAWLANGRLDDSIRAFRESADLQQTWESLVNLSAVLIERSRNDKAPFAQRLEDITEAITAAKKAVTLLPTAPQSSFNLALALELSGQILEAQAEWERFVSNEVSSAWAAEGRSHLAAIQELLAKGPQIIGGTIATASDYSAVFINGNCSATVVGPRAVLTAAHCVNAMVKAAAVFAYKGETRRAECEHHVPHDNTTHDGDWAMCKIVAYDVVHPDEDVDGPYATLSFDGTILKDKEKMTLSGFGATASTSVIGIFYTGSAALENDASTSTDRLKTKGSMILSADSGGGAFLSAAPGKVVAVNAAHYKTMYSYLSSLHRSGAKAFIETWAKKHGLEVCGVTSSTTECR